MSIFQHLACVVVDDRPDEVFGCDCSGVELGVLEEVRCESIPMVENGRIGATRWWLRVGGDVFRDDAVDHVRGACMEVSARGGG